MLLTETESKVLKYLRNPFEMFREKYSPINDLSNEDIVSLYNKMDAVIEDEGNTRRSLGNFDEMYVLELSSVKNFLLKEINKRGLNTLINKNLINNNSCAEKVGDKNA